MAKTRSRGPLVRLAHVAEARQALEDAVRCPGTGHQVDPEALLLGDKAICPRCRRPVLTIGPANSPYLGFHARPKRVQP